MIPPHLLPLFERMRPGRLRIRRTARVSAPPPVASRSRAWAAVAPVVVAAGVGCASLPESSRGVEFESAFGEFTYCEIDAVRQSDQTSCGAAALSSLFGYWGKPISEPEILAKHPPLSKVGYPLFQLREIARERGLQAFVIAMDDDPAGRLRTEIRDGRPVLIAVECPVGRYFGKPLPVVESVRFGPGSGATLGRTKAHYLVVIGFSEREWLLLDPAYGIIRLRAGDLLDYWRPMHFAALITST